MFFTVASPCKLHQLEIRDASLRWSIQIYD